MSDSRVDDGLALSSSRGRIALVATVGASGMASLDATVVYVALPHIGSDLDASVSALQWVLTGYLLALASFILLGGSLGDHYGRRKIFVVGTVWFAGASLLCGAAPTIEVLVAARVLQGVGAALLTPGSLAILQASFRKSDRAKAVGAWSGLGGAVGAIGPFVGGFLVDGPGWRWAFLLNVPVAAFVIWCTYSAVPETRDPHAARELDISRHHPWSGESRLAHVGVDRGRTSRLDRHRSACCWCNRRRGNDRVCLPDAAHIGSACASKSLSQSRVHGD